MPNLDEAAGRGVAQSPRDGIGVGTRRPDSYDEIAAWASWSARRPAVAGTGGGAPSRKAASNSATCRSKVAWKLRASSLK